MWIGAAVAVLAVGMVTREVVRSGMVRLGLLDHWWGYLAYAITGIALVGAGMHMLGRADRPREGQNQPERDEERPTG